MGLYTRQIENYIGGVSQQAYNLRYPNQFNEQINCVSSVVNGLIKRPPAELLTTKELTNVNIKTHKYSRSELDTENFLINVVHDLSTNDISLLITDLLGNEIPYTDSINALNNYVGVGNDINNLRFISLEDTTFIVNPNVVVEKGNLKSPVRPQQALVYVKQTDYGKEFKINIAGTEVSYTTPDGADAADSLQTGTDYVAEQLSTQLTGAGVSNTIIGGNVIVIDLNSPQDVLETSDGLGGRGLLGIKSTINRFEDLPAQAPYGYVVKVINTDDISADDYYCQFETDGLGIGTGSWIECVAPDLEIELDTTTMPLALVYDPNNNSFVTRETDWDQRNAGDDDTNPFPSFVNSRINDIFIFQDRLGLLTETFVVLSNTSNYFNFFRDSVIVQGDADVLDVGSNSYDSYVLHSAVTWNELLIMFSRDRQFVLRSTGSALTPKTVAINQAGSYESNRKVKPKTAGSNLLFPATNGDNTNIYEMYISNYESTDARNTTTHVSNYIPKNIKTLEVLDVYNLMACMSEDDEKTLYIYQYLFNGNEKVQNSYHKWTFDVEKIYDFKFIDNDLYIVCQIEGRVSILTLEINDIQKDDGLEFKVHLDKRLDESHVNMTFDPETNTTVVNLPFSYKNPSFVTRVSNGYPSGYIIKPREVTGNIVYFDGSITQEQFFVGENYTQYLEHSTMTSLNPYTDKVDLGGRVQLMSHSLTYDKTGYFETVVTKKPNITRTNEFWSKVLNDYESDFTDFKVKSGVFKYTVRSENTECVLSIINDTHLPCNIQSSEYAYRFFKNTN